MIKNQHRSLGFNALGIVLGTTLLSSIGAWAQETPEGGVDEARLVQRIKEQVLKELRNSDFLQKEIEAGIQRFVQKQRAAQARGPDEKARKNIRPVSVERDHIFGNPDAEISLIEYSDFECPYCKHFHSTAKRTVETYAGKINWVYRHFPLSFHNPGAQKQAEASECAAELGGNSVFWKYSDAIYQRTRSNGKGFPIVQLLPLAVELGLDEKSFKSCLDSGRHRPRVQEDIDNGTRVGIRGTPGTILINNKTGATKFVGGAVPFDRLKADIKGLLKP